MVSYLVLLVTVSSLLVGIIPKSECIDVPVAPGLSYSFYASNCPKLESIVRNHLKQVFQKDIVQAAGLLRLHFHDCFVQVSGWYQEYEGVTFATFRGAGHAVPIFKPSSSLSMFTYFLQSESLPSAR